MSEGQPLKSGYVAIIGRPNVGKSTLLNHLLGFKLSITSRKPQTTRQRILGVLTHGNSQLVFVDTPGIQEQAGVTGRAMNRYMNREATGVLADVDVVLFVIDGRGWRERDGDVARNLKASSTPVVVVLNKIDRIRDKRTLVPLIQHVQEVVDPAAILPVSALRQEGLDELVEVISNRLPDGPHLFDESDVSDRPTSFFIGELVREQLVRQLGDELPHRTAVTVESVETTDSKTVVRAIIWVERASQKGIVIGKQGGRLKQIGTTSRESISKLVGRKVDLFLVVKLRKGWTNDARSLPSMGYR